jgi:menaquinone-dependent protoporphyrinogen oxidase
VFGGRVSEDAGGFLRKNMAKNTPPEFRDRRDCTAIEAWAKRIADSLQDQLMAEGSR